MTEAPESLDDDDRDDSWIPNRDWTVDREGWMELLFGYMTVSKRKKKAKNGMHVA